MRKKAVKIPTFISIFLTNKAVRVGLVLKFFESFFCAARTGFCAVPVRGEDKAQSSSWSVPNMIDLWFVRRRDQ
jgi:hypothetical protein